jgi:FkbM family methyltransferase
MLKRSFKQHSHNRFFKQLAGFGRAINRFYENRNFDMHSNGELCIIKKLASTNPSVIIDGGANIGRYSEWLSQYIPGATVYAFEPVQDTFRSLVEKFEKNDHFVLVNKGLYKEVAEKQIHLSSSNTHSTIYQAVGANNNSTASTSIQLMDGDSFCTQHNIAYIDFMKLDIEGAEYDALQGFKNMLSSGKIRLIQFEYGYINITTKNLLIDYYRLFEEHGYIVGKLFPKVVEFRPYETKYEDFLGPNFIAVRKTDTEMIRLLTKK